MDGKGVYYFNNGEKFEGLWIKGKHEGSIKAVYYDENNQNDFFWGKNEIE
jgi:hypothetical protein